MLAVNFQNVFFEFSKLPQFFPVEWLTHVLCIVIHIFIFVIIDLNKSVQEMLQLLLEFVRTDVCSPNYLGVLTDFVGDALSNHASG